MISEKDNWLESFKNKALPLITELYKPLKVILFGSRVYGVPGEGSDIDVIIISDKFADIPFVNRMGEILMKVRFPKHVDYICYTSEEFEAIKNTSVVINDALKNGQELIF